MHPLRFMALDEIGCVAVTTKQLLQLLVANACKYTGICNLITVEVKNRQDYTVVDGVEELVRMPARCKCPCLGLAIAHHGGNNQVRVVERRAIGVGQSVTQLAALVNRSRRLRGDVAGNPAGETELLEQLLHSVFVFRNVGIYLAICSLKVSVGHESWSTVSWPGDVNH